MSNPITAIYEDYRSGISIKDLAAWYKIPPDDVRNIVAPAAIRLDGGPSLPPDDVILKCYEAGITQTEIGRMYGYSQSWISQIIKRAKGDVLERGMPK